MHEVDIVVCGGIAVCGYGGVCETCGWSVRDGGRRRGAREILSLFLSSTGSVDKQRRPRAFCLDGFF